MSLQKAILPRTFLHAPGVGTKTERILWAAGVSSWKKFLRLSPITPAGLGSSVVRRVIEQSITELKKKNIVFFADHLPSQEWWRLYPHFRRKAVFLDIETTGLSHYYDEITLVGLYDGARFNTLVAGHDLQRLSSILEPYDIVVTFNGTQFDLKFLKEKYPSLRLPPVHLDLRYILRRLGYSGGLKEIERRLGVTRDREIHDVDGLDATVLWARYLRGDIAALETLMRYNVADATILQALLHFSCQQLASDLLRMRSSDRQRLPHARSPRVSVRVSQINGSQIAVSVGQEQRILRVDQANQRPFCVQRLLTQMPNPVKRPSVVGIDLRGSSARASGWALLTGDIAETKLIHTDEDLIRETLLREPDLVSIDAPLTLPKNRCCTSDTCACRRHGIVRECERILWRRGVRVYPSLLPSMQALTSRGMQVAAGLRQLGFTVIESYPGAAQDIMRIPRKKSSLDDLRRGLAAFGLKGPSLDRQTSHDELDAITSAIVGYFYLTGDVESLGNEAESYLIIPRLNSTSRS